MKFHLHNSEARKYSESYDKIRKHIILKIQETFQNFLDVTESLEKGNKKTFTKPKKEVSQDTDADIRQFENENFRDEWKENYKWYLPEDIQ